MKAIRVHTPGGPEALRLEDVPEPKPEAGQAVVKIEAAGVNFIDVYQRTGLYKVALPFTLGQEAAGTVTALGTGVSEPRVGTRVAYCGILGAYAPYAAVPADRLVALPDGVTARQGAAAMLQGMRAQYGRWSGRGGPLDPQVLRQRGSRFLTRPTLHHYVATGAELGGRAGELLGWVARGEGKVRIDRELPLAQAAKAHKLLEGRKT